MRLEKLSGLCLLRGMALAIFINFLSFYLFLAPLSNKESTRQSGAGRLPGWPARTWKREPEKVKKVKKFFRSIFIAPGSVFLLFHRFFIVLGSQNH